jgi:GDPmannose 4,6-dehydratase
VGNKKAIIFGAGGQDGQYLAQLLRQQQVEVFAVSRKGDFINGDVGDYAFVAALIKTTTPDYIFHLAADSTTAHDAWLANHTTICNGSLYIMESVKLYSPGSKVFLSGSGLQFVNNDLPIKETAPFIASSPYAVSRIQSVYAARYYRSLGIQTYVGYFFNHDSPLRSERHMTMKIVKAVLRIAQGSDEKIVIGDLRAKKEWGFAGDIVRGVWQLVNQEGVYEAVIGTGRAHSLREWVNVCFAMINQSPEPYLQTNDDYTSPYKVLVSDPSTVISLGWKPEVDLQGLAEMMLQPIVN